MLASSVRSSKNRSRLPDQYPLSLNALVNACNQKSNREPLMQLDEATVKFAVDSLARRHYVVEKSGFGSRVPKYQQVLRATRSSAASSSPHRKPPSSATCCSAGRRHPVNCARACRAMAELPDTGVIEALLAGLAIVPTERW
jgi:hypothetical protein